MNLHKYNDSYIYNASGDLVYIVSSDASNLININDNFSDLFNKIENNTYINTEIASSEAVISSGNAKDYNNRFDEIHQDFSVLFMIILLLFTCKTVYSLIGRWK